MRLNFLVALRCTLSVLAWCGMGHAFAQALQPVPALSARVVDVAQTLSASERQQLEQKLAAFEQAHGSQLVVLLVNTTQPEDISAYAHRVADSWKIGRKQVGDGVLVVIAKQDRKLRIEVARALEGAIPDLAAKRIIREQMAPRLQQGDMAGGLHAGVDQLIRLIEGEQLPAPTRSTQSNNQMNDPLMPILVGFVVGVFLLGVLGRFGALLGGTGSGVGSALLGMNPLLAGMAGVAVAAVLWSMAVRRGAHAPWARRSGGLGDGPIIFGGGSGWGGGGNSGGGFSSGGGGDFSGGGASGDW